MTYELDKKFWTSYLDIVEHIDFEYKKLQCSFSQLYWTRLVYKLFGKFINFDYSPSKAVSFNQIFYHKNLLKNMVIFWLLNTELGALPDSIIDVGCGAAPSTLAYIKVKSISNSICTNIKWIDQSKYQLGIAKAFIGDLYTPDISCRKVTFDEKFYYEDLVVLSYVLCEQPKTIKNLCNNINNFLKGIIVIDYKINIDKMRKYLSGKGQLLHWNVTVELPKDIIKLVGEQYVQISGCYFKSKATSKCSG